MIKTFYTKTGERHTANKARKLAGGWNINLADTDPAKVSAECGLYLYSAEKCCQNAKPSELIFNNKTGTCTRMEIPLTTEEITAREEMELRMQFEQEQEDEREKKFKEWKVEKEAEKQAKKEKSK